MARAFENYKVAYIPEDLLTIHWEVRKIERSYDFVDDVSEFYLKKFEQRINMLSSKEKHRVLAVIALDRAKLAFYYKKYNEIFKILHKYDVSFEELCKYIVYLAKRFITKTSYGFNLD